MHDLTYYFGAGASCNSMPLVTDFHPRFCHFIDFVGRLEKSQDKESFLKDCQEFIDSVYFHLSFDTFFKKLFHQRDKDRIDKYKTLLLIYFLFEHLAKPSRAFDRKKFNNDPRYEALIAGLLKPLEVIEFYTRVNFITWNYDLNLLNSLKNFLFPGSHLNDCIKRYKIALNHVDFQGKLSVTHLNGMIEHPKLNDIQEVEVADMLHFLNTIIQDYFTHNSDIKKYSASISFCWENLSPEYHKNKFPSFIEKAKKAILNSSNIIIAGYSFPLYNREVDTYLLNRETLDKKKVFIQDPNADELKEVLRNDFGIYIGNDPHPQFSQTHVTTIPACNSFFVPNNIFPN
jgi:hypothetical protein